MKLGVNAIKSPRAILEHLTDGVMGVSPGVAGIIYEDVLQELIEGIPLVNTCIGAQVLEQSDKHLSLFYEGVGIVDKDPVAFLYGFISPTGVSDLMEMTVSNYLLTGDVGPQCGFVQGCGIPCSSEVFQAFPKLDLLLDALHQIQYCGEVAIGVTEDFQLCSLKLGHCTAAFALFTELSKQSPQSNYEYSFGKTGACLLHEDRISLCTLLSYPPYPHSKEMPFSIMAPNQAERHLFRHNLGKSELAYVAAFGSTVFEARRRVRKTIENCRKYYDSLQYRIDYGKYQKFVFNSEVYKERGGYL